MKKIAFRAGHTWATGLNGVKKLRHLLFSGLLTMLLPLSALSGVGTWTAGTGLPATGLGNQLINALAVSPDGLTVYAGTGSGTVLSYAYLPGSVPTPGVCATVTTTYPSAPPSGMCTAGSPSAVVASVSAYTWTCQGQNGGIASGTCSAARGYFVTPSAGSNGSISPTVAQLVTYNSTQLFTVTASAGYTASVAGTCGGALAGNTYTTSIVTANCSVAASFAASSGPICTLAASRPNPVRPRQSNTLTVTCNPAATSYSWTGTGCATNTTASCTVKPVKTTTYSVTGTKGLLTSTASATVTVKAVDLTPILMLLLD